MRLPESRIKQAIFHAEEEVRMVALNYFADTSDESIMPLVIEAVDRYS